MRAIVGIILIFWAYLGSAVYAQPFNRGQPHPHFEIPAIGEGTIEVIVGLQFIEVGE